MPIVVLYFQVHQPFRIKPYETFAIGQDRNYFDGNSDCRQNNRKLLQRIAKKCYLPANEMLLALLTKEKELAVTFSLSGLVLEQFEAYAPEVLESFQKLVATGRVELLAETYHHSLASLYSKQEFISQIELHISKIREVFGYRPTAFRNTELIYNNGVAKLAEQLGFEVVLAEGVERYLGWRSPNFVYRPKRAKQIKLLLKNHQLSDDIAFRFSHSDRVGRALDASTYAEWLSQDSKAEVVNVFMDYETIGEHHWKESGIFEFMRQLPRAAQGKGLEFATVSQAARQFEPRDEVDMPEFTSWADKERDVSAWLENPMQMTAARSIYELESEILQQGDEALIEDWRKLQTSDHFYYMSTKQHSDGEVHQYFSPHDSPFQAYVEYMNVLHDLRQRVYTGK